MNARLRCALLSLLASAVFPGCMTPAEALHQEARDKAFTPMELVGAIHRLTAYFKTARSGTQCNGLNVYIEGDGQPWLSATVPASDPTPRHPLMLRLMALDESAALYLGRPCYNGRAEERGCSALSWTHRRYAPEIIDDMTVAVETFLGATHCRSLRLFGHSGGGTLALLLARRLPQTQVVITIGANLDIEAWAAHHGYSPLAGSLNPATEPNRGYRETHYYGQMDTQTPPALFAPLIAKRGAARMRVIDGYDHTCCWDRIWPAILREHT